MAGPNAPTGLIDTDILVDAARKLPAAVAFVTACQARGELRISIISAMELIAGCRDKSQLNQVQQFLATAHVLPVTESISQTALRLMTSYSLSHGLMLPDALIAATAMEHGAPLHTRNIRHFQPLAALGVAAPY